jgi:hypothetical protein
VLTYTIEVVKKLEDPMEKVLYLTKRWINVDEKKIIATIEDKTLKMQLPEETYLFEGLQISKRGISRDIFKYLPEIEKVVFIEEYRSEKKREEKPQEGKAAGKTEEQEKKEVR